MDSKRFLADSKKLMTTAECVYLTTLDGRGDPITRAMLNLRNRGQYPSLVKLFAREKKEFVVYFTTNTSSEKIRHLVKNPSVSAYYCNPRVFHGFMLGGRIQIISDPKVKKAIWQEGWEMYYPDGYDDPDYTVLRLMPRIARGWYKSTKFIVKLPT